MTNPSENHIIKLAEDRGLLRYKDIRQENLSPEYIRTLCSKGLLEKRSPGLYSLPNANFYGREHFVGACKFIENGVICLFSALVFHEVTTQLPNDVWMSLPAGAGKRKIKDLPLQFVWFSSQSHSEGVENHIINGAELRVYSPAKTIADCFKYRNKYGINIAIEALKECWNKKKCTMREIHYYAKICRVENVMKPYLEMLVAD